MCTVKKRNPKWEDKTSQIGLSKFGTFKTTQIATLATVPFVVGFNVPLWEV